MAERVSFGAWLRQRRRALDLTRDELARRVGYSVSTLRRIESDDLRPSRQLAESLADHLDLTSKSAVRLSSSRVEAAMRIVTHLESPRLG